MFAAAGKFARPEYQREYTNRFGCSANQLTGMFCIQFQILSSTLVTRDYSQQYVATASIVIVGGCQTSCLFHIWGGLQVNTK